MFIHIYSRFNAVTALQGNPLRTYLGRDELRRSPRSRRFKAFRHPYLIANENPMNDFKESLLRLQCKAQAKRKRQKAKTSPFLLIDLLTYLPTYLLMYLLLYLFTYLLTYLLYLRTYVRSSFQFFFISFSLRTASACNWGELTTMCQPGCRSLKVNWRPEHRLRSLRSSQRRPQ